MGEDLIREGDTVAYRPRPAQGWGIVTAVEPGKVTAHFYVGYTRITTGPPSDFELVRRKEQDDDGRRTKRTA